MIRIIAISRNRVSAEEGFNLVEMVVAVTVFGILLAGLLFFFQFGLSSSRGMQVRTALNQEAANVMEKMVRQIRVAYRFIVPTVVPPMTGNPIYFTGDVRGDGTDRNIMFYRTTGNLLYSREDGVGDTEMAKNVTTLVFTYYRYSGDAVVQCTDGTPAGQQITSVNRTLIKRVDIQLIMQRSVGAGSSPVQVEKKASVIIRSKLTT